jgi:hypothetical protein
MTYQAQTPKRRGRKKPNSMAQPQYRIGDTHSIIGLADLFEDAWNHRNGKNHFPWFMCGVYRARAISTTTIIVDLVHVGVRCCDSQGNPIGANTCNVQLTANLIRNIFQIAS